MTHVGNSPSNLGRTGAGWRASSKPNSRFAGTWAGGVVTYSLFLLLGSLLALYPFSVLVLLGAVTTLGLGYLLLVYIRRVGFDAWQVLLLTTLTGYMVLGYGFENLAIHVGGVPIIIGYALMYASLVLALFSTGHLITRVLREPAALCLVLLLILTFLHLLLDTPSYGIWAIRDASMFFDGIFLVLGFLWGIKKKSTIPLMHWLMVVFLLNLVNGFSLPWGEQLSAWSPKTGVFHEASLLGNYGTSAEFLLAGALFYMFLGRYVVRWPRWIMLSLALLQLLGLAILQARAMYVGLVVAFLILLVFGGAGKSAKFVVILSSAFAALLFFTTFLGIEISGRVGPVNINLLKENARSLTGAPGTPGAGIEGRLDWYDQAFNRIRSHPVLGVGFGQPLIDDDDRHGGVVRQPHNSSLSILARLGVVGFVFWVMFHLSLLARFLYAYRNRYSCDKQFSDFVLWLFLLYVIIMINISVEPGLEFPSGAIPFYFFVGLALGLIRYHVPGKVAQVATSVGGNRTGSLAEGQCFSS